MGEEGKQEGTVEEAKTEEKKEDKQEEKNDKAPTADEEKEEGDKPPLPFVLSMDLHCKGCAKKIQRSIFKTRGVEGVAIDMGKNEVTIKGVVEPEDVCNRIKKKTRRSARVVSPLPEGDGQPMPQLVTSQVVGLNTVELHVNMHCHACAAQLKAKLLKLKGVRTVETDLISSKVTVTGTMDADHLVDYVYRRTKKQAKVVPQPQPEPLPEESPKPAPEESPNPAEEEKKEVEKPAAEEDKKEEREDKGEPPGPEEEKKENGGGGEGETAKDAAEQEQTMQKMVYYYQPMYVIERIPAPQIFSDENPNACSIL